MTGLKCQLTFSFSRFFFIGSSVDISNSSSSSQFYLYMDRMKTKTKKHLTCLLLGKMDISKEGDHLVLCFWMLALTLCLVYHIFVNIIQILMMKCHRTVRLVSNTIKISHINVFVCICKFVIVCLWNMPVPSIALNRLNFIYYISIKQLVLSTLY